MVNGPAHIRALLGYLPRQQRRAAPRYRAELLPQSRYGRSIRDRKPERPAYDGTRVSAARRRSNEHGGWSAQARDNPGDARVAVRARGERMGNQLRPSMAGYPAADL